MRWPRWEVRTWRALGVAALSILLMLVAAGRSLVVAPLPAADGDEAMATAPALARTTGAGAQEISVVLRGDPFAPERHAPATRFRLPGEAAPTGAVVTTAALRLIGVALIADGRSFALVQAGGDTPRLVRIGEKIGGYTLRHVERDRATFAGPDGKSQDYRVTKAGS